MCKCDLQQCKQDNARKADEKTWGEGGGGEARQGGDREKGAGEVGEDRCIPAELGWPIRDLVLWQLYGSVSCFENGLVCCCTTTPWHLCGQSSHQVYPHYGCSPTGQPLLGIGTAGNCRCKLAFRHNMGTRARQTCCLPLPAICGPDL